MDDGEMRIFRLEPRDGAAAAELEAACFSSAWSEEQWQSSLENAHCIAYGMRRHARLEACLLLLRAPDELEIANIATRKEERRRGHARRLLETALSLMERLRVKRIVLEVGAGNVAARALYDSMGFECVGLRKAYWRETGEDALIMSRAAGAWREGSAESDPRADVRPHRHI
jgi:ribosomal-protein-alanine N-acetyltransferase